MPALADTLQFNKAQDAIKYRQSALFVMGQHFASLGAMANGRTPLDAPLAQHNAQVLQTLAALPWQAFGAAAPTCKACHDAFRQRR